MCASASKDWQCNAGVISARSPFLGSRLAAASGLLDIFVTDTKIDEIDNRKTYIQRLAIQTSLFACGLVSCGQHTPGASLIGQQPYSSNSNISPVIFLPRRATAACDDVRPKSIHRQLQHTRHWAGPRSRPHRVQACYRCSTSINNLHIQIFKRFSSGNQQWVAIRERNGTGRANWGFPLQIHQASAALPGHKHKYLRA